MAKQRAAAVQQYLLRVTRLQLQGDVTSAQRQQDFADYLKRVGDGTERTAVVRALLTDRQLRQLTATCQQTGCLNPVSAVCVLRRSRSCYGTSCSGLAPSAAAGGHQRSEGLN